MELLYKTSLRSLGEITAANYKFVEGTIIAKIAQFMSLKEPCYGVILVQAEEDFFGFDLLEIGDHISDLNSLNENGIGIGVII